MFKKWGLITLAIVGLSGCSSIFQNPEAEFESLVKTNGFYYSEGNSKAKKAIEEQLAKFNLNSDSLSSASASNRFATLTFDDLSENRLTYIIGSGSIVDGKVDKQSIEKKVSSNYRVSSDQNGGYRIRFYENTGSLHSDYLLRANSKGEIRNYTFIAK
ncbi:hypothetical protein [Idiomarina sp. HP20-50]|uniref:hypothetical protein n=1 Tax=Idiomarina sp. HP20-50 TaxID=3070813 RepID=UPI00294AD412|nr:hypothetical protein [Idiomarina sp. HP20-50]MDV6317194.1 hypothetical protein [Idiomarina sp. HP20-50]